jgi:nucleobase:cation symporter-1, NCS1 family
MGLTLLSTALAMVLPMHQLEPFLLLLSSVFVPLFGVMLGSLGYLGSLGAERAAASPVPAVNTGAVWIWVLGIGVFHATSQWAPQWSATLPSLLFSAWLGLWWARRCGG